MKFAFFLGCNIPARVKAYESSARALLARLGVELVDFREFTCCGYPLRNTDRTSFLLAAAGNLALAEQKGLDVLALCKCCFGSLKEAQHRLQHQKGLREEINDLLGKSGLHYEGRSQVKHLLSVLHGDVGLKTLKSACSRRFKDLGIATHYGCHALRPSKVTQFDDPVAPTLFDQLVEVTGASSLPWEERLNCCGAPLMGVNESLSMALARKKLESGLEAGASFLCTACPYCQLQFDQVQQRMIHLNGGMKPLPSILYPQLLGLCMGMDAGSLGLGQNQLDIQSIGSFLIQE